MEAALIASLVLTGLRLFSQAQMGDARAAAKADELNAWLNNKVAAGDGFTVAEVQSWTAEAENARLAFHDELAKLEAVING